MSNSVSECFNLLDQAKLKLKDIENDILTREKLLEVREGDLDKAKEKLIDDRHELEAFNKVSMYNKLNKKIEELENENRLLKRSQELRILYKKNNDITTKSNNSIIETINVNYLDEEYKGSETEVNKLDNSVDGQVQVSKPANEEVAKPTNEQVQVSKPANEEVAKPANEQVQVSKPANEEVAKPANEQVQVSKPTNEEVAKPANEDDDDDNDNEDELETITFEGSDYHTDEQYLYDMTSGDAVAYKKGKKFKFYKKSKGKNKNKA